MINTSEATMLPFLKKSYRYDPIKDFTPIALVVTSWTVFAVNPKVPAEHAAGAGRLFQEPPGGTLRLGRHRRRAAHRGRDAQAQERRQFRPRAVSRRRAGRDRRDLRPDRDGVDGACVDPRRRERPAQDSGAGRPEPASDAAGRADHQPKPASPTCAWTPGSALVGPPGMPPEIVARLDKELAAVIAEAAGVAGRSSPSSAWRWTSSLGALSSSHSWPTTPGNGGADPGDGHSAGRLAKDGERMAKKTSAKKAENADLAERQEGRRLDHGDVRDLARRQRAELFGADHASEERHRRSRRQGLVDLRRPRRRLAADADVRAARHAGDVLRQCALHGGLSGCGQADRQVRLRHRRAFLYAGRSAVVFLSRGAERPDPQKHRHARRAAPARRSPAGAARWWRSRRRRRACSSRTASIGPATSPTPTCRSRFTRRTARSPACRPPTFPTTACCARPRAICSTCIAAPSTICARTRPSDCRRW